MESEKKNQPRWIAGVEPASELRDMSMIQLYEMECREQPQRVADAIAAYAGDPDIRREMERARSLARSSGPVLFIGMGASYCSCVVASTLLQGYGVPSFALDAGEWLHYGSAVWNQFGASVLVTASGESAELVELCKKNAGKPFALVCNNERGACWSLADIKLPVLAGPEYGNATKTYTNTTAACIALASHIAGRPWMPGAQRLLEVYAADLERVFGMRAEIEEFCSGTTALELVGRGAGYGGAVMGSLCIREMSGRRTAAHTGAGFRHGPILDVNQSHVAMILALGHVADLGVRLAGECNRRGGKVILVSAERHERSEELLPISIADVPEPWEGITSLIVPQALTLGFIEKHGANLRPRFEYGVMEE